MLIITSLCACSTSKQKQLFKATHERRVQLTTDSLAESHTATTNTTTVTELADDSITTPGSILVTDDEWPQYNGPVDTAAAVTIAETEHLKVERITQPGQKPKLKVTEKPQVLPVKVQKQTTSTTTQTGNGTVQVHTQQQQQQHDTSYSEQKNKEAHLPWYVWAAGLVILLLVIAALRKWLGGYLPFLKKRSADDTGKFI